MCSRSTIAVIGTAGRGNDANKVDARLFERMVRAAKHILANVFGLPTGVCLVSGGAAISDHVAVRMYLESNAKLSSNEKTDGEEKEKTSSQATVKYDLQLYLPSRFSNEKFDKTTSAGIRSNALHSQFERHSGISSLNELDTAIRLGAKTEACDGFHARNSLVAKSNYMIAFTWSSTGEPSDGGTLHTWRRCQGTKIHVNLAKLAEGVLELNTIGREKKQPLITSYFKQKT